MLGVKLGALYSPDSSVVRTRVTPRSVSMIVTVAPATTPLLWSVTVPRIRPKSPCENTGKLSTSNQSIPPKNCEIFLERLRPDRSSEYIEFISHPLTHELDCYTTPHPTFDQVAEIKFQFFNKSGDTARNPGFYICKSTLKNGRCIFVEVADSLCSSFSLRS